MWLPEGMTCTGCLDIFEAAQSTIGRIAAACRGGPCWSPTWWSGARENITARPSYHSGCVIRVLH